MNIKQKIVGGIGLMMLVLGGCSLSEGLEAMEHIGASLLYGVSICGDDINEMYGVDVAAYAKVGKGDQVRGALYRLGVTDDIIMQNNELGFCLAILDEMQGENVDLGEANAYFTEAERQELRETFEDIWRDTELVAEIIDMLDNMDPAEVAAMKQELLGA